MKLATLKTDHPDGSLLVVSRDLTRAVYAAPIAATMRDAIDRWAEMEAPLRGLASRLEDGDISSAFPFQQSLMSAPLPRPPQWLDGSVFENHTTLSAKAFGMEDKKLPDWPLMYQGLCDYTLGPVEDVLLPSENDGIDFEGEFAVIVDAVPMGISADAALAHVKLITLVNDWSLRGFGPAEMRAGFGFIRAKPATAFAPVAVTPDEVALHWDHGCVGLDLHVHRNGRHFGHPNGREMAYHFGQLIAHAAYNRRLSAGSIIGSGTVSNETYRSTGSACILEQRSIEIIDTGAPSTGFLKFGETVRMEAFDESGGSVFGAIDQCVVAARGV